MREIYVLSHPGLNAKIRRSGCSKWSFLIWNTTINSVKTQIVSGTQMTRKLRYKTGRKDRRLTMKFNAALDIP